jgi:hypothetical protein
MPLRSLHALTVTVRSILDSCPWLARPAASGAWVKQLQRSAFWTSASCPPVPPNTTDRRVFLSDQTSARTDRAGLSQRLAARATGALPPYRSSAANAPRAIEVAHGSNGQEAPIRLDRGSGRRLTRLRRGFAGAFSLPVSGHTPARSYHASCALPPVHASRRARGAD